VPGEVLKLTHKTIKKVEDDIESLSFNTAISAMMILVNEMYRLNTRPEAEIKALIQILAPFAPHLCEELWEKVGGKGFVSLAPWPKYDPKYLKDDVVTVAVQVNGKTRGTIEVAPNEVEATAVEMARTLTPVKNAMDGKNVAKVIYKPGKILNLIVR
jgi:leucyl-tRNA synthetase